jgi:hypothetical protein
MNHPTNTAGQGARRGEAGLAATARRLTPARGPLITFAIYFTLRWFILGWMEPVWFSDTQAYAAQYQQGFGGGLLGQGRPWGYPLFLWLTGYHFGLAAVLQRALAALAWFALARAAAGLFRRVWLQRAIFSAVLALSMALFVIQWDVMLLSESLSVTCFAALTAAWCRLAREQRLEAALPCLGLLAALAVPFAGLRDSSAPLLILLTLFIAAWASLRFFSRPRPERPPRRRLAAALALAGWIALVAAFHHHDAQASKRGWSNLCNVLSMRAFVKEVFKNYYTVDSENVAWMGRRFQIPEREAAARIGRNAGQEPPISPAYRAWLQDAGPRAWASFLLHHPGWLIRSFTAYPTYNAIRNTYINQEPAKWSRAHLWPATIIQATIHAGAWWLLGFHFQNVILVLMIEVLGLLWLGTRRWPALRGYGAPLGALLWLSAAGLLAALVAFVGDSIETWRHALLGLVALYVALPLGVGLMIEAGLDSRNQRKATAHSSGKTAPAPPGKEPRRRRRAAVSSGTPL